MFQGLPRRSRFYLFAGMFTGMLISIAMLFAFAGSPLIAGWSVLRAAERGDRAALNEKVDFPAVRESLLASLDVVRANARALQPTNPLVELLSDENASAFADRWFTADGMIGAFGSANAGSGYRPRDALISSQFKWGYMDMNRAWFQLVPKHGMGPMLTVYADRDGLFGWRFVEAQFAGLDGLDSGSGPVNDQETDPRGLTSEKSRPGNKSR